MKIYFNAAITTDESTQVRYKKINEILERFGHKVIGYEIHSVFESLMNSTYRMNTHELYKNDFERNIKFSDVLIVDLSIPSSINGYHISQALALKKPVLALKHHDSNYEAITTLANVKSPLLTYKTYDIFSLETILKNFMELAKDKVSTKFIMIIPAEIDRYLEWNTREMRKHKAEVTRYAIEKLMKRDKNYKKYLNGFGFPERT